MAGKGLDALQGQVKDLPITERKGRGRFYSARGTKGKQTAGIHSSQLQYKMRVPGIVVEREIREWEEGFGV